MEELRVMVIGAHPDDADLLAGLTTLRLVAKGARVRYVSACNGDKGHQTGWGAPLAVRRRDEAQRSAKILGVEKCTVLDNSDCELEVTMKLKRELTRLIREFSPHYVMTHRICDYHADHRAVGTALMDLTYFLGVPGWCPEVPLPSVRPVILFLRDTFTVPRELRPDLIVPVNDEPRLERYFDALASHVSQFAEWLPFDCGIAAECPDWLDVQARNAYLRKHWIDVRKGYDARRFGVHDLKYVEAFEISEYGRQPTAAQLRADFGDDIIIKGREWMPSR